MSLPITNDLFELTLTPSVPRRAARNYHPPATLGVVYTRPWVVDLILDLAGYTPQEDLAAKLVIEPAAGDGAFLLPMVQRLIASCRIHDRPLADCCEALLASELNEVSAQTLRASLTRMLCAEGAGQGQADVLARAWVRSGDFLLEAQDLARADFVIGNPPYVRLEEIQPAVASIYRTLYPTMVGRADLYIAFFEAALRQLKPGGVCAFICADRWMLNQYGAELRRLVTSAFSVETVVEMHKAEAFDAEVNAYPAVTIIRHASQGAAVVASANPNAARVDGIELARTLNTVHENGEAHTTLPNGIQAARVMTWFCGADPWPCVSPERLALLKRLEAEFLPLESDETQTIVGIGVATGCDDIYITLDASLVEPSRLLPLAMAGDAKHGKFAWSGHYLVDPWQEEGLVDLQQFPRLAAYIATHKERLKARNVGKRNPERWYRTIDRVNHWLLPKPKLYFPDIKSRISPILDREETYPHHNLYFVQSDGWDMEVLGGLLLSRVAQFFVECYGVRMRGGYLRFQAQSLRRIRVPHPEDIAPDQAECLRHAFRNYDIEEATQVAFQLYRMDHHMGELLGP